MAAALALRLHLSKGKSGTPMSVPLPKRGLGVWSGGTSRFI